jgi:hypothetical protein
VSSPPGGVRLGARGWWRRWTCLLLWATWATPSVRWQPRCRDVPVRVSRGGDDPEDGLKRADQSTSGGFGSAGVPPTRPFRGTRAPHARRRSRRGYGGAQSHPRISMVSDVWSDLSTTRSCTCSRSPPAARMATSPQSLVEHHVPSGTCVKEGRAFLDRDQTLAHWGGIVPAVSYAWLPPSVDHQPVRTDPDPGVRVMRGVQREHAAGTDSQRVNVGTVFPAGIACRRRHRGSFFASRSR